ncbi:MAG: hypothetical protein AB4058_14990 [Microcystaceae cyanobacterium]
MNQPSSDKPFSFELVKRFLFGASFGLLYALILWSYSLFAHTSPSLTKGIIGSLVAVIICGLIATFTSVEELVDNLPWI